MKHACCTEVGGKSNYIVVSLWYLDHNIKLYLLELGRQGNKNSLYFQISKFPPREKLSLKYVY